MIYSKWYHDSEPCVSMATLTRRLTDLMKTVNEGYKRYLEQEKSGIGERKVVTEYKALAYKKDELFDIFPRKKW